MEMCWQFGDGKGVRLLAGSFAERVAAADVDRRSAPKIGQREVHPSVATEGRAEERKERLVLIDWEELSIAERPAFGREHEAHDADFGEKGFSHTEIDLGGEKLAGLRERF